MKILNALYFSLRDSNNGNSVVAILIIEVVEGMLKFPSILDHFNGAVVHFRIFDAGIMGSDNFTTHL